MLAELIDSCSLRSSPLSTLLTMKTETILLRVKKITRTRLAQRGVYGDSMDSIIKKLLNEIKK